MGKTAVSQGPLPVYWRACGFLCFVIQSHSAIICRIWTTSCAQENSLAPDPYFHRHTGVLDLQRLPSHYYTHLTRTEQVTIWMTFDCALQFLRQIIFGFVFLSHKKTYNLPYRIWTWSSSYANESNKHVSVLNFSQMAIFNIFQMSSTENLKVSVKSVRNPVQAHPWSELFQKWLSHWGKTESML